MTTELRKKSSLVCHFVTVFIITPGFQVDEKKFPEWPYDMAVALNRHLPQPHDDPNQIKESVIKADLTQPVDQNAAYEFILFDWADLSQLPGTVFKTGTAEALHYRLFERIRKLQAQGVHPIDLHFIGHSRGCYVNAGAIRLMAANPARIDRQVRMIRMITLDPYSVWDGNLLANPGGIVDWQENYFQSQGLKKGDVRGNTVRGGFNVDLTDVVSEWNGRTGLASSHKEIHDWYHWMIDERDEDFIDGDQDVYTDKAIQKQQQELASERKAGRMTTRKLLYGQNPIVQTFFDNKALFVKLFGKAKTDRNMLLLTQIEEHTPASIERSTLLLTEMLRFFQRNILALAFFFAIFYVLGIYTESIVRLDLV